MKKKYISPELILVHIEMEHMVAESRTLDMNNSGSDGSVLIKRDRSSRGSYNVWDDDWQNP